MIMFISLRPRDTDEHYHDDDADYVSPLECAAKKGHVEIVKLLLAGGALRNGYQQPGDEGWLTDYKAEGDQVEVTRAFIKAGAYLGPYHYDKFMTPLMLAAGSGKTNSAALLIKAGCEVNAQDNRGANALMMAASGDNEGAVDTIRLLLKSGAEVNYKDSRGFTALLWAARAGRSEAVRLLLSAGADVFSRGQSTEYSYGRPDTKVGNAFEFADSDAVKQIVKSEMHRRIAAALSLLPSMPVDVRKNIIKLYVEN